MANTTRTRRTTTAKKTDAQAPEKAQPSNTPAATSDSSSADIRAAYEAQIAAMQEQMRQMQEQMSAMQRPQIVQVAADVQKVDFLYNAEVCDENVYEVGPGGMFGRIVGKVGRFSIPKSDLSRAMDIMFRQMMERRWIVVVSGMTDEEREAYGVAYKDGELLTDRAFRRMIEIGGEILDIYPRLCNGHKEMVEKRFFEAWREKSPYIRRDIVARLKELAVEAGRTENAFTKILQEMNAAEANA